MREKGHLYLIFEARCRAKEELSQVKLKCTQTSAIIIDSRIIPANLVIVAATPPIAAHMSPCDKF